jgi:hypothetical protein
MSSEEMDISLTSLACTRFFSGQLPQFDIYTILSVFIPNWCSRKSYQNRFFGKKGIDRAYRLGPPVFPTNPSTFFLSIYIITTTGLYIMEIIPTNKVMIQDEFWGSRLAMNASKAINHQWEQLEKTGCIQNFYLVADGIEGIREGRL